MAIRFKAFLIVLVIVSVLSCASCIIVNNTTISPSSTITTSYKITIQPEPTYTQTTNVSAANAELATVRTAITAAMADAQVTTITNTGTLSSSTDFTVASGYKVSSYIFGGISKLRGTYTIDLEGNVVKATYPGVVWGTNGFH